MTLDLERGRQAVTVDRQFWIDADGQAKWALRVPRSN